MVHLQAAFEIMRHTRLQVHHLSQKFGHKLKFSFLVS